MLRAFIYIVIGKFKNKIIQKGTRKLTQMNKNHAKSIKGLNLIDNGENNTIEIDETCVFERSVITIDGNNNHVSLGKALSYRQLSIHLKEDNKRITVQQSTKHIIGLKISSTRGSNQEVSIGNNFSCGGIEMRLNDGDETLTIGDNCLFSWGIHARTSDGHSIIDRETNKPINFPENIKIGDRVWICEDVRLMKGSVIPSETVVGAASLVTKKFEEQFTVIAGVPAKVVRRNVKWDGKQPSKY